MRLRERYQRWRNDMHYKRLELRDKWRDASPRFKIGFLSAIAACITLGALVTAWAVYAWNRDRGHAASSQVVLYTSCDAPLLAPIIQAFEEEAHARVEVVSDTEATKTTGLVQRLLSEREHPRCDVWWSNESLGTALLAREGLFQPFRAKAEADFPGGWPDYLCAPDHTWYGFAVRARVIAYNTNRLQKSQVPTRLRDLTQSAWAGRVGMARPQFGTARTHIAALISLAGEDAVRNWLAQLKAQDLRLYDSNSAVVQALANGEIDIGLTDTDDCFSAVRENWPVKFVLETPDKPNTKATGLPSFGPVVIPNTVARVKGSPNPNNAQKLADFLLSDRVERMLAESDSHNMPTRPSLVKEFPDRAIPEPAKPDPKAISAAQPAADRMIAELFPLK
jgi:iron(III) transport system substrate-binding protein